MSLVTLNLCDHRVNFISADIFKAMIIDRTDGQKESLIEYLRLIILGQINSQSEKVTNSN